MGVNYPQDNWQRGAPSATASVSAYATAYFAALPAQWRGRSLFQAGKMLLKTENPATGKKCRVWVPIMPATGAASLAASVQAQMTAQPAVWSEYSAT